MGRGNILQAITPKPVRRIDPVYKAHQGVRDYARRNEWSRQLAIAGATYGLGGLGAYGMTGEMYRDNPHVGMSDRDVRKMQWRNAAIGGAASYAGSAYGGGTTGQNVSAGIGGRAGSATYGGMATGMANYTGAEGMGGAHGASTATPYQGSTYGTNVAPAFQSPQYDVGVADKSQYANKGSAGSTGTQTSGAGPPTPQQTPATKGTTPWYKSSYMKMGAMATASQLLKAYNAKEEEKMMKDYTQNVEEMYRANAYADPGKVEVAFQRSRAALDARLAVLKKNMLEGAAEKGYGPDSGITRAEIQKLEATHMAAIAQLEAERAKLEMTPFFGPPSQMYGQPIPSAKSRFMSEGSAAMDYYLGHQMAMEQINQYNQGRAA